MLTTPSFIIFLAQVEQELRTGHSNQSLKTRELSHIKSKSTTLLHTWTDHSRTIGHSHLSILPTIDKSKSGNTFKGSLTYHFFFSNMARFDYCSVTFPGLETSQRFCTPMYHCNPSRDYLSHPSLKTIHIWKTYVYCCAF